MRPEHADRYTVRIIDDGPLDVVVLRTFDRAAYLQQWSRIAFDDTNVDVRTTLCADRFRDWVDPHRSALRPAGRRRQMEAAVGVSDRLLIESRAPELDHRFRPPTAGRHVDAQTLESDVGHFATLPSPADPIRRIPLIHAVDLPVVPTPVRAQRTRPRLRTGDDAGGVLQHWTEFRAANLRRGDGASEDARRAVSRAGLRRNLRQTERCHSAATTTDDEVGRALPLHAADGS